MPPKRQLNPDQLAISFDVPQELEVTYGPEGSYVDIRERAERLVFALGAISDRNSRKGFAVAPFRTEYSGPIWARYQENTETVIAGAARNVITYDEIVKKKFWRATGYGPLRAVAAQHPTFIRPRSINPDATKMWEDFNDKYGAPNRTLKERTKYKKQLLGSLAIMGEAPSADLVQEAA